jgi:hypothetical protein
VNSTTLPRIPARVVAGAALLDQQRPGWHQLVDPARLDLEDVRADVLGQLYGWFDTGLATLAPGLAEAELDAWAVAHGFDLDDSELGPGASAGGYPLLTACWQAEITRRRAGGR